MQSFTEERVGYYRQVALRVLRRMLPMVEANRDPMGARLLRMMADEIDSPIDPSEDAYTSSLSALIRVCEAWIEENEMDV